MKAKKACIIIYIVAFCLMLALPIVTINRVPGKVSVTEKRNLAVFPELFDSEGHVADGIKESFETWLGDNIGFRSAFMDLAAEIKVKLLNQSTTDRVEIGRDGWYFYTMDHHLDIARGTYPNFDETVLERICRLQEKIQEKLEAKGIEYVLVLPPSKASIYPEYISSGDYSVTRTPVDMLADYLEENTDITVVRLKQTLLDAKQTGQVYFKTDTHWNDYGAYAACTKIADDLARKGLIPDGENTVTFDEGEYVGEFSGMMGSDDVLGAEPCPKSTIANATAEKVMTGETYEKLSEIVRAHNINNPFYYYVNQANGAAPTALVFGDSMFGSWNVTEQLAEHFSELTFVWDYNIYADIIESVQPDVVIYEMVERFLNQLPIKSVSYLWEMLTDPQAEIVDIAVGEGSIDVTVKNTGSSEWSFEDGVSCCIWDNGVDSNLRAGLPLDREIGPGDTVTVSFDDVDVDSLISNAAEVQMLQEGVCYFGERERIQD